MLIHIYSFLLASAFLQSPLIPSSFPKHLYHRSSLSNTLYSSTSSALLPSPYTLSYNKPTQTLTTVPSSLLSSLIHIYSSLFTPLSFCNPLLFLHLPSNTFTIHQLSPISCIPQHVLFILTKYSPSRPLSEMPPHSTSLYSSLLLHLPLFTIIFTSSLSIIHCKYTDPFTLLFLSFEAFYGPKCT